MSDQYDGKEGNWLYNRVQNTNTIMGGDEKPWALALSVNVNMSLYATVWRSSSNAEKYSYLLTHEVWRFTSAKKDIEESCEARHAKLQMFVPSTCSDFPRGAETVLTYLQKAEE